MDFPSCVLPVTLGTTKCHVLLVQDGVPSGTPGIQPRSLNLRSRAWLNPNELLCDICFETFKVTVEDKEYTDLNVGTLILRIRKVLTSFGNLVDPYQSIVFPLLEYTVQKEPRLFFNLRNHVRFVLMDSLFDDQINRDLARLGYMYFENVDHQTSFVNETLDRLRKNDHLNSLGVFIQRHFGMVPSGVGEFSTVSFYVTFTRKLSDDPGSKVVKFIKSKDMMVDDDDDYD